MKKFIVTTIAAATMAAGFAGQASASEQPNTKVITQKHVIALNGADQESIQKLIEEVKQTSNLQDLLNKWNITLPELKKEMQKEEPAPEQKEEQPVETPKVEQPAEEAPQEEAPQEEAPQAEPAQPVQQPAPAEETEQNSEEQSQELSAEEQQMVNLVNEERQKQGLAPLNIDVELTKVARVKAQDMIDNNYFAHQSPTYGSPFEMLDQFGVSYNTAGENLAGNQTVEAAHQALMNSDGHRANILGGNYSEVGIGIVDGGPYGKMFVQLFKG
ncbi:CAP domain-containing protein [Alkalihalophilus pseudofirmus]|uniref:CAP domain-containing protein n=1 Tax=Alkalihalophilus pseudofirmus TaxID=79885 RepID=A0AAJ2NNJ0_ALKPS|nr:CAP domain-containing protein [Alkalihalophilus pseudofirmus]MDV2885658.1 CAP domain-containing protein [Alkalihalophilus pseudofirmus]